MAGEGCLFVCTFGNCLAPVLIAAHTANNLDFDDEQDYENEGHKSDYKKNCLSVSRDHHHVLTRGQRYKIK